MTRFTRVVITCVLVTSVYSAPALAGQESSASRSKKGRWIGLAIGAGAGFAAGVFLGLEHFDEAINSDRKVWSTAILGAAGGGVAGFLVGRQLERGGPRVTARELALPAGVRASTLLVPVCSVRLGCGVALRPSLDRRSSLTPAPDYSVGGAWSGGSWLSAHGSGL